MVSVSLFFIFFAVPGGLEAVVVECKKASSNERASWDFTFLFTFVFPRQDGRISREYRESGGVRVLIEY